MNIKKLGVTCLKSILVLILPYNAIAVNSLGDASDSIFDGVNILTKFFWAACVFTGVFLLTAAITNYKSHRNNPKLVPISTVIVYVILGLIVIMIPFINRLFGADSYDTAHGHVYYQ